MKFQLKKEENDNQFELSKASFHYLWSGKRNLFLFLFCPHVYLISRVLLVCPILSPGATGPHDKDETTDSKDEYNSTRTSRNYNKIRHFKKQREYYFMMILTSSIMSFVHDTVTVFEKNFNKIFLKF